MILTLLFALLGTTAYAWDASNPESVRDYVYYVAGKEGVDVQTVTAIADCESGFNKNALAHTSKEYSVGVFQINLKAHRDITEADAWNPFTNINWAIDQMAQGKFYMWTCYKMIS